MASPGRAHRPTVIMGIVLLVTMTALLCVVPQVGHYCTGRPLVVEMEMEGLDLETQVEGKIRLETGQAEKTVGRWFSEWIWKATFVDLLGWVAGTAARTAVRSRD